MDIKALGKFVVLSVVEAPTHIGRLEIPEENRERIRKRNIGRVLSVGSEVTHPVKVGDVIAYRDFPNPPCYVFGLDGEARILVPQDEIVGHVESDRDKGEENEHKHAAEHRSIDAARNARMNLIVAQGGVDGNRIR